MTDALCSVCGLALHRYSPNHEGSGTDLMGCVNSLRGEVDRLERERDRETALRRAVEEHNRALRQYVDAMPYPDEWPEIVADCERYREAAGR